VDDPLASTVESTRAGLGPPSLEITQPQAPVVARVWRWGHCAAHARRAGCDGLPTKELIDRRLGW